MDIIPNFAVFEGGDGSGTTTQLSMLTERLKNTAKPVFFPTFEPTDGRIGRKIRVALKRRIDPKKLARLFAEDRSEHLYGPGGILERVNRGELVVSDRYVLSSLVYQGIECGDKLVKKLNSRFPAPEVLIFLDIEPEIAISRIAARAGTREIYEYHDFQVKVREKYKSLLETYRREGVRVQTIDASKSAQEIADRVWSVLCEMPIFKVSENSF